MRLCNVFVNFRGLLDSGFGDECPSCSGPVLLQFLKFAMSGETKVNRLVSRYLALVKGSSHRSGLLHSHQLLALSSVLIRNGN